MGDKIEKLKSRKLWVTALGAVLVSIGTQLGFPQDTVNSLVAVIVAYLIGQGIADHGKSAVILLCGFLMFSPGTTLAGALSKETPPPVLTNKRFSLWDATQAYALVSYSFDSEEFGGGIRIAYNINDHVRIRADYVSGFDDFADGQHFGADSNISLAFLYPVSNVPGLEVYTITGLGVTNFDDPALELLAGLGVEYTFKETWRIFSEYQYSSEEEDSVVRVGVGVTF